MNFRAVATVVFLVVVSSALLVHFRNQSLVEAEKARTAAVASASDIPEPSKSGPFPKATVVGSSTYNFGTMEHGQSGEHTFTIKNEGEAPLKMVARKEDHSCQCTLGTLAKEGLEPGEETTVKLNWEIKNPSPMFQHWAKIRTNDPKNQEITFHVRGTVGHRLVIRPNNDITLGTLSEGKPTERTVMVHSEIFDSFKITKIETSSPNITGAARALTPEELRVATQHTNMEQMMVATEKAADPSKGKTDPGTGKAAPDQHEHPDHPGHSHADGKEAPAPPKLVVKSGYEIKFVIEPKFPVGLFRETATIHTDGEKTTPITVTLQGNRSGPIQFLATTGFGWSPEQSLLNLGRFPANQGKKIRLLVFVNKLDEEFKITEAKFDPPVIKHEFVKDTKFQGKGREKFDLFLEIPPSDSLLSFTGDKLGSIVLQTNHPEAATIKWALELTSY